MDQTEQENGDEDSRCARDSSLLTPPSRGLVAMKFGGTSMGTAASMTAVAEIIEKACGEKVPSVVVSATSGTTDSLIDLGKLALSGGDWQGALAAIVARHDRMVAEFGIEVDLQGFWSELRELAAGVSMLKELSLSANDRLIGFGERISSTMLAAFLRTKGLKAEAVDAYELVFTDNNFGEGNVDFERTNEAVQRVVGPMLERGVVPVITGFVGQAENGAYVTLGRGGSDYTCAIVGAALEALEVQIWTDVDGILNVDPRLVSGAAVLPQLSFDEAAELAYFGAKVLHPKTIKPAIEKDIAVRVLNTFNPSAVGTVITGEVEESLKSVTYKKGISIINVCSAGMLEARGFLARLFEVFARHQVSVDVISTSEVSVSMTVEGGVSEALVADLEVFAKVQVEREMAIVCVVGEGIRAHKSVLGELFTAVREHEVSMVSQGASKRNITFVVPEAEAPMAVQKIYNQFFN